MEVLGFPGQRCDCADSQDRVEVDVVVDEHLEDKVADDGAGADVLCEGRDLVVLPRKEEGGRREQQPLCESRGLCIQTHWTDGSLYVWFQYFRSNLKCGGQL